MAVRIDGNRQKQRRQIFFLCSSLEQKLLEKQEDGTIAESCNEQDITEWFVFYAKQWQRKEEQ